MIDAMCSGEKPKATETAANYANCSYSWDATTKGAWSGDQCRSTSQRTVEWKCVRVVDGIRQAVSSADESFCPGPKPHAVERGGGCNILDPGFEASVVVASATDLYRGYIIQKLANAEADTLRLLP